MHYVRGLRQRNIQRAGQGGVVMAGESFQEIEARAPKQTAGQGRNSFSVDELLGAVSRGRGGVPTQGWRRESHWD